MAQPAALSWHLRHSPGTLASPRRKPPRRGQGEGTWGTQGRIGESRGWPVALVGFASWVVMAPTETGDWLLWMPVVCLTFGGIAYLIDRFYKEE